jgi:hypothetical protein
MSGTAVALFALGAVDVAALSIGISIRRRVTRIIGETAASIEDAVHQGIADAIGKLIEVATALMGSRPETAEALAQVVERIRS